MQPISDEAKALFEAHARQVLDIRGIDRFGNSIRITDADIISGTFSIDRYVCDANEIQIGTAIASEMTMTLNNFDHKFDSAAFEGTELLVKIGVADWTQSDPEIHWLKCGYFTPDRQPRTRTAITINALDRMTKFDVPIPVEPLDLGTAYKYITDQNDNHIRAISPITLPLTIQGLVQQACIQCQVPFTQDISGFVNADYVISELPNNGADVSFRNIIQWCAGFMACNAYINHDGELYFDWFMRSDTTTTGYESRAENRFSSDVNEDTMIVDGIVYYDYSDTSQTREYWVNRDYFDYPLDMTGNRLMPNSGNILDFINQQLSTVIHSARMIYTPFVISAAPAPYLWPMDKISIIRQEDQQEGSSGLAANANRDTTITNVHFTLNGNTHIQAVGETKPGHVSYYDVIFI